MTQIIASQNNSGWKGSLEVISFKHLLKAGSGVISYLVTQGFCLVWFSGNQTLLSPRTATAKEEGSNHSRERNGKEKAETVYF